MTERPLRLLFAGTPAFAALHLKHLIESEHQLIGVYTQPDRRAGRGRQLQASPVKQLAEEAGLPVFQPQTLRDESAQSALAELDADLMVVVAYGLILPQEVLEAPRLGCVNVHASLLPRWRGAAPIQRAIEAGDAGTGITIMQMDAGLDTGDMLGTARCPIGPRTTAADLQDELAQLGPALLLEVLHDLEQRQKQRQKQSEVGANYAHKIHKAEAELDWSQNAQVLDRKVRAFNPVPVCYAFIGGKRVRVWRSMPMPSDISAGADAIAGTIVRTGEEGIVVRCGEGELVLQSLQMEGGKALSATQILRAHQDLFSPGNRFAPAAGANG